MDRETKKRCPICGKEYTGPGALSRADNLTEICADCGEREAVEALPISDERKERILEGIAQAKQFYNLKY